MPSTYSNNLRIELIATGEQDSTWGITTNTNLGTTIEEAVVGRAIVTFPSNADYTLTYTTSNASQPARAVYLVVQSAVSLSASRNLIVPTIFKNYVVKNDTSGSQDIVVKTSAGTGVTIPPGKTMSVYVNGTSVIQESDYFSSLYAVSPEFTGTPIAPTAAPGTNTTQIATTAFTTAAITTATGSLGTMSTQNANNVAITGGSITGITDLAIADGGTGASTAPNARTNLGLAIGTDIPSPTGTGASGTWNISISGNAVTATTATNVTNALGSGQTWQNVTSSRALATTYTNTTGKPIQIVVTLSGSAPGQFSYSVVINGNTVTSAAQDFGLTLVFIVPDTQTYRVNNSDGLSAWWELR